MTEPVHKPYDSPLRWEVRSRSESGAAYVVDLGANQGLGECQCAHFRLVALPLFRKGGINRCWHLNQALEWFREWAIWYFDERDQNHKP